MTEELRGGPGAEALHCVWMRAGLVTYKLCDRGFECELCPLDAGLRGQPYVAPHAAAAGARRPRWHFPVDRSYSPRHLWLMPVAQGALRVGLDELAAGLLATVTRVQLAPVGSELGAGEVAGELSCGQGSVELRPPLAGTLLRHNPLLASTPERVVTDPYQDGWLFELAPAPAAAPAPLLSAAELRGRLESDVRRFERRAAMLLLTGDGALGARMADGGELLADLRRILGEPSYLELVTDMLG